MSASAAKNDADGALRISIVTPCLNDARYVEQTLQSLHQQGYPALEHIVIDGGSRDGSVEVIRTYADRLAYWCAEPDEGHADAQSLKGVFGLRE